MWQGRRRGWRARSTSRAGRAEGPGSDRDGAVRDWSGTPGGSTSRVCCANLSSFHVRLSRCRLSGCSLRACERAGRPAAADKITHAENGTGPEIRTSIADASTVTSCRQHPFAEWRSRRADVLAPTPRAAAAPPWTRASGYTTQTPHPGAGIRRTHTSAGPQPRGHTSTVDCITHMAIE